MARSDSAHAQAFSTNEAGLESNQGGRAGNDIIDAADGDNAVAGDAMAVSDAANATATGNNPADYGGVAGNDDIATDLGDDTVSGGAQARAETAAIAPPTNTATANRSAGNDEERQSTRMNYRH